MSAINVNSITGRTGSHGPVLTGVTTISGDLHVGSGLSVTGVSTFSNTVVGGATTELVVGGDARITGILTIGTGSITIDGTSGSSSITGVTTAGISSVYGVDSINDLGFPTAGPLSNRNLIINGAMQVAQRGTSTNTSTNNSYPAIDRFRTSLDVAPGVTNVNFSQQTVTDLDGFTDCYRISSNQSRTAALSGGDRLWLQQGIEAQNLQHLNAGQANAKALTLSFYLRSSITSGSIGLELTMSDSPADLQAYYYSVTVPGTADTWQKYTVPIAGNTSGAIDKDNGVGLLVSWQFAAGPAFVGGSRTEGVWTSNAVNDVRAPSDNIDLFENLNDYVEITGVQLEVGTRATPFEHRSYADELARCQRYYYKHQATAVGVNFGTGWCDGTAQAKILVNFPVEMRDAPASLDQSGTPGDYSVTNTGNVACNAVVQKSTFGKLTGLVNAPTGGSLGTNDSCALRAANTNAFLGFSAEL